MRALVTIGGALLLCGLLGADTPKQPPLANTTGGAKNAAEKQPAAPQATRPEDEKAVRQLVEQFAKAYNAADADAAAKLFAPDAEIVDENGQSVQGRPQVQQIFAGIFAEYPKTNMKVEAESIRFIAPAVAVEDGMNTVVHAPGETAERSRYELVYVKQDGKWLIGSARDLSSEPLAAEEQLKQLDWLLGEWYDESSESIVVTNYHWADDHKVLIGEFQVQIKGRPAMSGSQRIGWDPAKQQIRSWVFDTEGGFASGLWTRDGDRWIVKMTGVNREGKTASATNVMTMVNEDRMTWQSRDRVVGGEVQPDIDEISIVRKPPQPK
jgi:uncharacterized protein (TIGR02246 family)